MIAGLSIENFTILHTAISLIAIASGLIVLAGMLRARRLPGWTALFLVTTILTSVTGFMFPINGLTPAIVFGLISIVILAIALDGALREAPERGVEMDLRHDCAGGALFQRFCSDRAVLPEGAGVAKAGTDAIRAAVPDCAGGGSDRVSHSWSDGRAEISPGLREARTKKRSRRCRRLLLTRTPSGSDQQGRQERNKRPFWFVLRKLPYRRPLLHPT